MSDMIYDTPLLLEPTNFLRAAGRPVSFLFKPFWSVPPCHDYGTTDLFTLSSSASFFSSLFLRLEVFGRCSL